MSEPTTTLAVHVHDLMLQATISLNRAERFLQVLERLLQDERIPPDIRLEYAHRAQIANNGGDA